MNDRDRPTAGEAAPHDGDASLPAQREAFQAAINGAPLVASLGILLRAARARGGDDLRCAFYRADPSGTELRPIAGMPEPHAPCVDGFEIGPDSPACGLAAHNGEPVITVDVTKEPRWRPWLWLAERYGYRAVWSFPVETTAGKVIGAFAMYHGQPREATQHDRAFAAGLARAAAVVISRHQEAEERARAEAALRVSEMRQAALLRLSDLLRTISDPAQIRAEAMRLLGEQLGLARVYWFDVEREPDGGWVHVIERGYQRDPAQIEFVGPYSLKDFNSGMFEGLARGEVVAVADVADLPELSDEQRAAYRAVGVTAFINVPLLRQGSYTAGIGAHDTAPHHWTQDEFNLIREVAARTWIATERAQAEAALRASEARYHALFAASPVPFMVLSPDPPDFAITAANEAYLAATLTTRVSLVGRKLFDVFTDDRSRPDADGPEELLASLDRVLRSRRADAMPRQRYDITRPEGGFEARWWLAINAPVLDATGRVTAIIDQVTNVTELHLAEACEREHQARQAFLLTLSDALRPVSDPVEMQLAAMRMLAEHLDVMRATYFEVEGDQDTFTLTARHERNAFPILDRMRLSDFAPDMADAYRAGRTLASRDTEAGAELETERAAYRAIGIRAWIGVPLVKDGRLIAIVGVHSGGPRDWTNAEVRLLEDVAERTWAAAERARTEAALRDSEARYRSLFERIDEGFCIIEVMFDGERAVDYRFVAVNPAFERHTGIPDAEGRTMREIAPGHEEHWFESYGEVALTGQARRFEAPAKNLGDRWYDLNAFRIGEPEQRRVAVVFSDITQRRRDAAALRESEERLRSALSISTVGVMFWSAADALVDVNDAFLGMTGFARPEALGKTWRELTPPEFQERSERFVEEVEATGQGTPYEKQCFRKDGSRWWGLFAARKLGGGLVEFVLDVSARREAEAARRESEDRFRQFAASSSDALWIREAATLTMEYTSPAIQAIYGIGPDAILGDVERWRALILPEDRETATKHLEQARAGEAVVHEFRIRRPSDDEVRWIRNTDFPLRDERDQVQRIGGIAEDVTEARHMQERQGVLVAELQHRTRNLMGVVRSIADKTLARSVDLADFRARFGDRLAALSRVQGLLSRLDEWDRVTFDDLLRSELAAINGEVERIALNGPEGIALRSSTVQTFALALHELVTNALKYGALAQPNGRLAISWRVERAGKDGRPWLHVDWRESGVTIPVEGTPTGGGSGRELITRALPYQLKAKTTYVLAKDGVHCTIALPVSERSRVPETAHA